MNFKKFFLSLGLVASFGLVACGSDSSSSASEEGDNSSSSTAPVVLPEANGDSLFTISGLKVNYTSATQLVIAGAVIANVEKDTLATIDSVGFQLANAAGNQLVSNFSFTQLAAPMTMLSLGSLNPTLDVSSVTDCGAMKVYLIVYGHGTDTTTVLTAISEAPFEKTCTAEESSSSAAEPSADPTLTAWKVTLSTSVTEPNAVDLDSKATYLSAELAANVASLDLYLAREGSNPILYTNGNLDGAPAASSAIVPETKSLADYVSYPNPATVSMFAYKGTPSISASDFEQFTSFIVMTSEYDAATGKGFFVVLPHEVQSVGSEISMTLTILGVN